MTIAGEEAGGDNQLIPIAHMIRIFCVVIAVPTYLHVRAEDGSRESYREYSDRYS